MYLTHLLQKQAKSAIGIPDRANQPDPKKSLEVGKIYTYLRQNHIARVRGQHEDVRIGNPEIGLHSWATAKGDDKPNATTLIHQPLHSYSYKDFQGLIPGKQYGAGTVKKLYETEALITKKDDNSIHLTLSKNNQRIALIGPRDGNKWLEVRAQPLEHPGTDKPQMKSIPKEDIDKRLDNLREDEVVQPKVDGSFILLQLNKHPELLSQRLSKKTGNPIVHTERVFHSRPKINLPKKFKDAILFGELYGESKGKVIPAQQLGGLLNKNLAGSIEEQKNKHINLRTLLFDINRYQGQSTEKLPYKDRLGLIDELLPYLPKGKFEAPESVTNKADSKKLLQAIRTGKHRLTNEGLIIRDLLGNAEKAKLTDESNVYIRKIFEGTGRLKGNSAGGFEYSHLPNSPIVGKVGTGLSDELRRDMWQNKENYLGLKARVHAQERYSSGALRAPALISVETTT